MEQSILIADNRDIVRNGLRTIFKKYISDVTIYEATTFEEVQMHLQDLPQVLIFIHQSLICEIELLAQEDFVVLATELDLNMLLASQIQGAKGYLLESSSAELFYAVLQIPKGAFLIDPCVTSPLIGQMQQTATITVDQSILTIREQEILTMLQSGVDKEEIANTLSISPFTLKTHLKNITRKIGRSKLTLYLALSSAVK